MSVINTNLNALVSQESSRASNLKLSRSMERLSTGLRINSAKDDAAGLAITNRMTSQVRGIQMAIKNSNDAISMSQTAEGAYGQVGNILQRMRELAVQSATGTNSASDRSSIQLEVTQLVEEINHIADTTNFNNIKLLDGTAKDVVIRQVRTRKTRSRCRLTRYEQTTSARIFNLRLLRTVVALLTLVPLLRVIW